MGRGDPVQTLVGQLTEETRTRAELRDVCIGAVLGAIRPLLDEDPPPTGPADGRTRRQR